MTSSQPSATTVERSDSVKPAPGGDGPRGLAIAAAAAVFGLVIAVIVAVGYVPLPDYPVLADDPDPAIPGTVAFVRDECVLTVPAGGGPTHEVLCRGDGIETLAWTREGNLAIVSWQDTGPYGGRVLDVVDPVSGARIERIPDPIDGPEDEPRWRGDRSVRDDGAFLVVERPDRRRTELWLDQADGTTRMILGVDGPRDYELTTAQWSPDGDWILVTDSRDGILVLAADGDPNPRLLVDRDQGVGWDWSLPAWFIEGDATYTVDPG